MMNLCKRITGVALMIILVFTAMVFSAPLVSADINNTPDDTPEYKPPYSYSVSNGGAVIEEWYETENEGFADIWQEIYDGIETYYPVIKVKKIPNDTTSIRVGEKVDIDLSSYENLRYIYTHEGNIVLERANSDQPGGIEHQSNEWILTKYEIYTGNKIVIPQKIFGISIEHCSLGYDEINGYVSGPIEVPSTVKSLGISGDFSELILHEGLQRLYVGLEWRHTPYLKKLVIPDSVTELVEPDFKESPSLESITIGKGVTQIPEGLLKNCTKLKSVYGCENITDIGYSAFEGCTNLETIPKFEKVTYIGEKAFMGCERITSFTFYEGLTTIGEGAFKNCKNLSGAIVLPDSLTDLLGGGYDEAFENCSKITSLHIGAKTNYIFNSFKNCTGITRFTVSENHSNIREKDGALYRANMSAEVLPAVINYPPSSTAKEYTAPNGVATLFFGFSDCKYLETINLPSSVESIQATSFGNVKTVNFQGTKAEWNTVLNKSTEFDASGLTVNYNWKGYANSKPSVSSKPAESSKPAQSSKPTDSSEQTNTTTSNEITESTESQETSSETIIEPNSTVYAKTETAIITGAEQVFPENTEVKIEDTFKSEKVVFIEETLGDEYGDFVAYEITATKDGVSVQPNGKITATFDVPQDLDIEKTTVIYFSEEGMTEKLSCSIDAENRKITAELEHFSTYLVVEQETLENQINWLYVIIPILLIVVVIVLVVLLITKKKKA